MKILPHGSFASAIVSAGLLSSGAAQAMEIRRFDKMATQNQSDMAADDLQQSKSATAQAASSTSTAKPMITRNSDGTFSIHKVALNGPSKPAKAKSGLAIPPQVVTPIFSTPEKK